MNETQFFISCICISSNVFQIIDLSIPIDIYIYITRKEMDR